MRVSPVALVLGACGSMSWDSALAVALVEGDQLEEDMSDPELRRLFGLTQQALEEHEHAVGHKHMSLAMELAPYNVWVRGFNSVLLLQLGSVEEAYRDFRVLVRSKTRAAAFPTFLQQYVVALHRLGKQEELAEIWPQIAATPGVKWRSPLQCPEGVDESLLDEATPFPSAAGLTVAKKFAKHRKVLYGEFIAFWRRSKNKSAWQQVPDKDLMSKPGCWTEIVLFHLGEWSSEWCQVFATACRILKGLPEIEGSYNGKRSGKVSLLKLDAGTYLRPHFGAFNWRYTAHLGLLGAEGAMYRVGGEKRSLKVGEVLVLDDTFLHEVANDGKGPRVNLVANFFHPKVAPVSVEETAAKREL